jgi:hypothetical protein
MLKAQCSMRKTSMRLCLCFCLATAAGMLEAQARQANDAEAFRRQLLDAFARGDRRAVAAMVRYRLVVDAGGLMVPIMSRADLLRLWDIVFPPEVRCMIDQSAMPRAQPPPKYAISSSELAEGRQRRESSRP